MLTVAERDALRKAGLDPLRLEVQTQLHNAGFQKVDVYRVHSAGDPLADEDGSGARRTTILFVDALHSDRLKPKTALLLPGGRIVVRQGW